MRMFRKILFLFSSTDLSCWLVECLEWSSLDETSRGIPGKSHMDNGILPSNNKLPHGRWFLEILPSLCSLSLPVLSLFSFSSSPLCMVEPFSPFNKTIIQISYSSMEGSKLRARKQEEASEAHNSTLLLVEWVGREHNSTVEMESRESRWDDSHFFPVLLVVESRSSVREE